MKFSGTTVALLGVIVLAGIFAFYKVKTRVPFEEAKPAVRETAPLISLADLSGRMVSLSEFKGRVVLVNFWASWCPPCKAEMPGFQRVYDAFGDKGFAVLAIALDDVSPSLIRDMGITFPVMKASPRVTRDYGEVSDVPVSFLVGTEGTIIKKVKKTYSEDALKKDVENALKAGS